MKHYELTFIIDPVLPADELKAAAQTYIDMIIANGGTIVNVDEMGLRQLAYPIDKRASGVYYCIEFEGVTADFNPKMELQLRRNERIMRFLTIALDKFAVKYNEDKRAGKIGTAKKTGKADKKKQADAAAAAAPVKAPAPVATPAVAAAAVVEAPVVVETPVVVEAPAVVAESAPVAVEAPVVVAEALDAEEIAMAAAATETTTAE